MARTRVGLEITEESVRAVEVTTGKRPAIVACGEVPLPPGAAKDSEVIDKDAVALALRSLWSSARIHAHEVVVAIGNRRILVREYSSPAMSLDLIKQALPLHVQDLLPVPVNQAVLDFYPIGESEGQVHGLLVAAVSETIEDIIETLKKAGLKAIGVDFAPFGLARVASRIHRAESAIAMVHIGDHTTYVVVAASGVPRFVRIIPADIATSATQRRAEAEAQEPPVMEVAVVTDRGGRASLRVAAAQAQAHATATAESVRSVSDLVGRIRSTISFIDGRMPSAPVGVVRVSGAGAANPVITSALAAAVNVPVDLVSVEDVLSGGQNPPAGETAFNLVTTLGVVLGEDA